MKKLAMILCTALFTAAAYGQVPNNHDESPALAISIPHLGINIAKIELKNSLPTEIVAETPVSGVLDEEAAIQEFTLDDLLPTQPKVEVYNFAGELVYSQFLESHEAVTQANLPAGAERLMLLGQVAVYMIVD